MKIGAWIVRGVLLSVVVAGFAAGAEQSKPDRDGFIRDWLLLSPIQLPGDTDGSAAINKSQVPDEGLLKPKAGDRVTVLGHEMTWKRVNTGSYYLDLNSLAQRETEMTVAYAVCYVASDVERKDLELRMGSNDQGKVYLNGKALLTATEPRTMDQDSDVAKNVALSKGVNVVVFKIFNEGGSDWQGCLRFTDAGGKAVTDLAIRLEP